jgi:abhydrolase domain-containing protein 17
MIQSIIQQMGTTQSLEQFMNSKIFQPPKRDLKNLNHLAAPNVKIDGTNTNSGYVSFMIVLPQNQCTVSKYIVYSHGTGDDIVSNYDFCKYLANQLNVGVVIYDYPGYGCSTGQSTEQGCYDSLNNVMFYLTQVLKIDRSNITLMGYSLGTGVVVDYALRHEWDKTIVLCAPYKSMISVKHDNILTRPIDKFVTISKIGKLKCPVKIFHGETDTVINVSHSKELFELVVNKQFKPTYLPNIGHELMGHVSLSEVKEIIN